MQFGRSAATLLSGGVLIGLSTLWSPFAAADKPSPSATGCASAEVSIKKPAPPGLPGSFPQVGPNLYPDAIIADILVVVNADGSVMSASVQRSSGNLKDDTDAVRAAYAATYNPKEVNCALEQGTYLYRAVWLMEHSP
jgi:TonB family protein